MTKWVSEFTVPADDRDRTSGVNFENSGTSAIMYNHEDGEVEAGGDGKFFVRLHSWVDPDGIDWSKGPSKNEVSAGHTLFREFMGKRVRVTVETIEG